MTVLKQGSAELTVPDHLTPPEKAGRMTPEDVKRIPRARRGIGLICDQAADAIEKADPSLMLPPGVTATSLREAGKRAEEIDLYLRDLDTLHHILQQTNLMFDADAWEQIRALNDQVKAQGKRNPLLLEQFRDLLAYFAQSPRSSGSRTASNPTPQ